MNTFICKHCGQELIFSSFEKMIDYSKKEYLTNVFICDNCCGSGIYIVYNVLDKIIKEDLLYCNNILVSINYERGSTGIYKLYYEEIDNEKYEFIDDLLFSVDEIININPTNFEQKIKTLIAFQ